MGSIRERGADRLFDIVNACLLTIMMLAMVYPLYFSVIASVSDPYALSNGNVSFRPIGFTMEAYENVFRNDAIWRGYGNTILYTVCGTAFALMLTIPGAYVLSRKKLPLRAVLAWYVLIPMYFSGGLVPTYLQVKSMGLLNRPYTLIVLGSANVFNVIVSRVYFDRSIPEELYESARIDGASELRVFFAMALPLAAPIIAVVALYYAVERWNDYFLALVYTSNSEFYPLQLVLRGILIQSQNAMANIVSGGSANLDQIEAAARQRYLAMTMKYALIFIASAPMLCLYPFVQKYFVKGIMLGSLKG